MEFTATKSNEYQNARRLRARVPAECLQQEIAVPAAHKKVSGISGLELKMGRKGTVNIIPAD